MATCRRSMLGRTVRLITVWALASFAVIVVATAGIVAARLVAVRLVDRSGADIEYQRVRVSLFAGIVLNDVTIGAGVVPVPMTLRELRIPGRRRVELRDLAPTAVSPGPGLPAIGVEAGRVVIEFAEPARPGRIPALAAVRIERLQVTVPATETTRPSVGPDAQEPAAAAGPVATDAPPPRDSAAGSDSGPSPAGGDPPEEARISPVQLAWSLIDRLVELVPAPIVVTDASVVFGAAPAAPPTERRPMLERVELSVERLPEGIVLNAAGGAGPGSDGSWSIAAQAGGEAARVSLVLDRFDLASIAALAGPPWTDRVRDGALSLSVEIACDRPPPGAGGRATAEGLVTLEAGAFLLPEFDVLSVGPISASYEFDLLYEPDARLPANRLARRFPGAFDAPPLGAGSPEDAALRGALVARGGRLTLGSVSFSLLPSLYGFRAAPALPARLDVRLSLPPTEFDAMVDALPAGVLGPLAGVELDGRFGWELDLEAPLDRLSWTGWYARTELEGFSIRRIDPAADVRALHAAFLHRIPTGGSRERVVAIPPDSGGVLPGEAGLVPGDLRLPGTAGSAGAGAGVSVGAVGSLPSEAHRLGVDPARQPDPSYVFVPLDRIPPILVNAVVTTEDGEFYRHEGINWLQVKTALERNLAEREVVFGASTIAMQLAKNLFLGQERLLARKLQEAMLVGLMRYAALLPRERVMEIYLNVIEFGPGIHGVHDAARYYFGRQPSALSASESVWLATILPSPGRLGAHFRSGIVPPAWLRYMRSVMDVMLERGRLTPEQHAAATIDVPRFRRVP